MRRVKVSDLVDVLVAVEATAQVVEGFTDFQWRMATALANERHAATNGYQHTFPSVTTKAQVVRLLAMREEDAAAHVDPFASIIKAEGRS